MDPRREAEDLQFPPWLARKAIVPKNLNLLLPVSMYFSLLFPTISSLCLISPSFRQVEAFYDRSPFFLDPLGQTNLPVFEIRYTYQADLFFFTSPPLSKTPITWHSSLFLCCCAISFRHDGFDEEISHTLPS